MANFTETLTQFLSMPAAALPPANYANNATAYTVGPVSAKYFRRFMGFVNVGVLTGSANVQIYLQGCNTSNGTFANVSNTNQAVLLDAANTCATVEVRSDQLNSGNKFIQLAVLVNANSAFCSAQLFCGDAHYSPASDYDANSTYIEGRTVVNGPAS